MKIKKNKNVIKEVDSEISFDIDDTFKTFADTLKSTNINLNNFYHKIKTINLTESKQEDLLTNTCIAMYNVRTNEIKFIKDYYKIAICHELFHLTSSYVDDRTYYIGFSQEDLKSGEVVGFGLNEAYTALLDNRYFDDFVDNKKECVETDYKVTKYFASMIEDVIGNSLMEKWYSEANLYSLTKFLANKTNIKSTLNFYKCLDIICYYLESGY